AVAGGSPCTRAMPAVGVSRSARMRSTVDLPHPDGPRRDKNCPSWLSRSTPSSATTRRRPIRNSLRSPVSDRPEAVEVAAVSVVIARLDQARVVLVDPFQDRQVEQRAGGELEPADG